MLALALSISPTLAAAIARIGDKPQRIPIETDEVRV